jgi:hypothetical protein
MPLRLNIGRVPEPENRLMMFAGAEIAPVKGDPFATTPPQDVHVHPDQSVFPSGGTAVPGEAGPPPNTRQPPPAGASPPEPSVHPDQSVFPSGGTGGPRLAPVAGDPFGGGGGPPPPTPREPSWRDRSDRYVVGQGWEHGQPDPTAVPPPGTPRQEPSQTTVNNPGWHGWTEALLGDRNTYSPRLHDAQAEIPGQAPQLTFEEALTGNPPTPTMSQQIDALDETNSQPYTPAGENTGPFKAYNDSQQIFQEDIEELRNRINATPVGTGDSPDKRFQEELKNQPKGGTTWNQGGGDHFGGHASAGAQAAAGLIPLTNKENLKKRIAIYSADLNVPPDRFFTDNMGNIKWIDLNGRTWAVTPSMEGGSWTNGTKDMMKRTIGTVLGHSGEIGVQVAGAVGGYIGGSGPAARLAGGMAGAGMSSAAVEVARQVWGNYEANKAGYTQPPGREGKNPLLDIDPWNVLGQAIQNMGFEAFARIVPVVLNGMVPSGLFGTNVYRLNRQEIQDLAWLLEQDEKIGGPILKRAQAAHELGIPLTPADLLQTVDGHGFGAGYAEIHGRLLKSFQQLESTLAGRTGWKGAGASNWMKNFYAHRQDRGFARAAETVLEKIAPTPAGQAAKAPKEGFVQFQKAGNLIIEHIEEGQLKAGGAAGWDQLFGKGVSSPTNIRADTRGVRQIINGELENATGKTAKELQEVLDQMVNKEGIPVGGYEKLHNIRMDVKSRIAELSGPGKTAADTKAIKSLKQVEEHLGATLRRNPLYAAGDDAYKAAGVGVDDAKNGLLQLLTEDPLFQERLGGALAEAGPTKIKAVKDLFEKYGMSDVFDAHTRAYLEHGLNEAGRAGNGTIGKDFYREVAGSPKLREGLKAMARDEHTGELLDQLVTIGHAMDAHAAGRVTPPGLKVNTSRLASNNKRGDMFDSATNPLGTALKNILDGQPFGKNIWREKGSLNSAVNLTADPGAVYSNMRQTAVPLAGVTGDALERSLYMAAPVVNDYTKWVPRATPEWLAKIVLPMLATPPQLDPTAPDLVKKTGIQGMMNRVLGPSPSGTAGAAPPGPSETGGTGLPPSPFRLTFTRPGASTD